MPRSKPGTFDVITPSGKVFKKVLIKTKKARNDMRKEGYDIKRPFK